MLAFWEKKITAGEVGGKEEEEEERDEAAKKMDTEGLNPGAEGEEGIRDDL